MGDHLNPWLAVPSAPPYWLPCDEKEVRAYNKTHPNQNHHVEDRVLPEPFIGKTTAPVVLLNLNPGFVDRNVEEHARPEFQDLIRNNYAQGRADFPFYYLDDRLEGGGREWWKKKLKNLLNIFGPSELARSILVIEYFRTTHANLAMRALN